jgi:WD40 repeat protein
MRGMSDRRQPTFVAAALFAVAIAVLFTSAGCCVQVSDERAPAPLPSADAILTIASVHDLGDMQYFVGLAISPDEKLVATGNNFGEITLWQVQPGPKMEKLTVFETNGFYTKSIAFHPNGKLLLTGGRDRQLRCWRNLSKPELASEYDFRADVGDSNFTDSEVHDILATKEGRLVIVATGDHRLHTFSLSDEGQLSAHVSITLDRSMTDLEWSTIHNRLLACQTNGHVTKWAIGDDAVPTLEGEWDCGSSIRLHLSPDGQWLAVDSWNPEVMLWRVDSTGGLYEPIKFAAGKEIAVTQFTPDSRFLVDGNPVEQFRLALYRLPLGPGDKLTHVASPERPKMYEAGPWAVARRGKWLVQAGRDAMILFWNVNSPPPDQIFPAIKPVEFLKTAPGAG